MAAIGQRMARETGVAVTVTAHTDRKTALEGADFVGHHRTHLQSLSSVPSDHDPSRRNKPHRLSQTKLDVTRARNLSPQGPQSFAISTIPYHGKLRSISQPRLAVLQSPNCIDVPLGLTASGIFELPPTEIRPVFRMSKSPLRFDIAWAKIGCRGRSFHARKRILKRCYHQFFWGKLRLFL